MDNKKKRADKKFFKIPQTKKTVKQNLLLAAGLVLVIIGIFLCVHASTSAVKVFAMRPVILICFGAVFLFLALAFMQNFVFIFFGLSFLLSGVLMLLLETKIIPLSLKELWPVLVIICGISLFPAGFYKMKRVRTVYLFPAITLVVLGVLFLMFSLRVIKISFSKFFSFALPLVVILFGSTLVFLYLWQQIHQKNFPYMVDDSVEADDDKDDDEKHNGEDDN